MKNQNKDVYEIIIKKNGNVEVQYETNCAIVCGKLDDGVDKISWANACDFFDLIYVAATALSEVKRMFKDQPEILPVVTEVALKIDEEWRNDRKREDD